MSAPTKVGIIGVGRMGTYHLRKYLSLPNVEVVGFYEANEARAAEVAKEFNVPFQPDLATLLFETDGVSVTSPTSTHVPLAKQALEAGTHVLIEKPLALDLKEGADLVRLAEHQKLILQVGFVERFRVNACLKTHLTGEIRYLEIQRHNSSLGRESDLDVIDDLLVHDLDLARSLMGDSPIFISATGAVVATQKFDIATARLDFPEGRHANLSASRVASHPNRALQILTSRESIFVDLIQNRVEVVPAGGAPRVSQLENYDALHDEISSFITSVQTGTKPVVDGADGLAVLQMALKVRASLEHSPEYQATLKAEIEVEGPVQ